ncbi:radical SAM protein [Aeromonas taiwanensis]|uniref:radical SAM protein n=1 Tax=Aeromonas taiwanensis TaxID=633417 RepID=UPI000A471107|nr:radical SAM protein [Aeromonas taiwanensis]
MRIPVLNLPPLPAGRHYRFHAMVKPGGARCNIDCDYCFYLHKTELLEHSQHSQMSESTLEQHIRQYIEAQTGNEVVFSWQGGEPTLMGLPFFERIVALQARYAKPGQRIANDLQTNGIALDDRWIAFLRQHDFHVGLSIDGPQALHDAYRKTRSGKSTFEQVMAAATRLREANIPFAALCVVNRLNALHPKEVYRFLVDEVGTWRVQFTPAVEPKLYRQTAPAKLYGRTRSLHHRPVSDPFGDDHRQHAGWCAGPEGRVPVPR